MEKKTYLFGIGTLLKRFLNEIDWNCLSGIVDNDEKKWGTYFWGKEVLPPKILKSVPFDQVIITSSKYFYEIYLYLHYDMVIPSYKIIGINDWLTYCKCYFIKPREVFYYAFDGFFWFLSCHGLKSVMDYGACLVRLGNFSFSSPMFHRWKKVGVKSIDAFETKQHFIPENFYSSRYTKIDEVSSLNYDVIFFAEECTDENFKEYSQFASMVSSKYILLRLPSNHRTLDDKIQVAFAQYGTIELVPLFGGGSMMIVRRKNESESCTSIYVVTHKNLNSYMENLDCGYSTIFVGEAKKETDSSLRDDVGKNISYLNPKINECTALYWIWKHSVSKYVGLCHYRRYFLYAADAAKTRASILASHEGVEYLEDYDIIVANKTQYYGDSGVLGELAQNVQSDAVEIGMQKVRDLIKERQSDYIDSFDYVMDGVSMYPCNMFITHRHIFDAYCSWLFSFIVDAAKEMDVSSYDAYSQRIIGFIAERMLTVWLLKHRLKIKELPIYLDENLGV